jgi:predicted DsbA family dithiol-disulfide isomerase
VIHKTKVVLVGTPADCQNRSPQTAGGAGQALGPKDLPRHAEAAGLDVTRFQECLEKETHAAKIRQDLSDGEKAGVRGTPAFFLGLTESNGSQVKAVRSVTGAQSYAAFKTAIDSLLGSQ